jgi:hypothetical protein
MFPRRACSSGPMLAGGVSQYGLIVWSTYKETRGLIMFEARPAVPAHSNGE